jgi:hypothetical protein
LKGERQTRIRPSCRSTQNRPPLCDKILPLLWGEKHRSQKFSGVKYCKIIYCLGIFLKTE